MVMEIVADTPTSEYVPPADTDRDEPIASTGNGGRWIDVNLSQQMVYAYEGDTVVNSFVVSTGVAGTPTVTGRYKIYVKVRMQDMSGPGYHLRDVPYVMFFYGDYGLHGTYWHNNFGVPMSRGCVNLTIDDAAWLFSWASVGTVVEVHY
jgi:lipoprotein-anchoring transpeptidase ErfK/SrfK